MLTCYYSVPIRLSGQHSGERHKLCNDDVSWRNFSIFYLRYGLRWHTWATALTGVGRTGLSSVLCAALPLTGRCMCRHEIDGRYVWRSCLTPGFHFLLCHACQITSLWEKSEQADLLFSGSRKMDLCCFNQPQEIDFVHFKKRVNSHTCSFA